MNFVDRVLVMLGSQATRPDAFTQQALKNVLKAGYGIDDSVLAGSAVPRFPSFSLGGLNNELEAWPAALPSHDFRIDALWRGSISISGSFPKSKLQGVEYQAISLSDVDAAAEAASGGVLPEGTALELARRQVLRERLAAAAAHADAVTDDLIEALLARAGVKTVGELLEASGAVALSQLQLAFSEPLGGQAFSQVEFPIAVAVLIRDPTEEGFLLANAVAAARSLQQAMRRAGFEPKQPSEAAGLGKAVTALVVPEAWFEDADWPGSDRTQRIGRAGAWMAQEGMALAVVS